MIPEYWTIVQAAKYLKVPPWELVTQSSYWLNVALICMQAEHEHQKREHEKQQRKAKRSRGGR